MRARRLTFLAYLSLFFDFFFNDTATTEIYTLSLHDALPIFASHFFDLVIGKILTSRLSLSKHLAHNLGNLLNRSSDRKSGSAGMPRPISYAVFCLKKKKHDLRKRWDPLHQAYFATDERWADITAGGTLAVKKTEY